MKLNKPSYGVFMVDIFASSVGIFILVSLLYIIESAKATSDEVMAEKFKTLVKRDKVPVDRYSLPANRDPLHDWGIRARHAREKKEALILLLRDKILLYHTMQTLDKDDIVDSEAISEYYQKYSKNRRLILEIHYHDAYHSLKAKIHESLPPDVHLWIHWAYNAGNIANPNPVLGKDNTDKVNMSGGGQPSSDTEQSSGMPSSTASANAQGQGTDAFGSENGQAGTSGEGSEGGVPGEGQSSEGNPDGGEADGQSGDGQGSGQTGQPAAIPRDLLEGGSEQTDDPVQQEIDKQMAENARAEQFIEEYLKPEPETEQLLPQESEKLQQPKPQEPQQQKASEPHSSNDGNSRQDPFKQLQKDPNAQAQAGSTQQNNKTKELSPGELAASHIKKNVYVSVPLFSPINHFQLDVQVPGYLHQRYSLNAMGLRLHLSPEKTEQHIPLSLVHGDAIIPQSSINNSGWVQVKVIKVDQPDRPLNGWLYGKVLRQVLMLPLYQNKVQSLTSGTEHYWFKQNTQAIEQFNTAPEEQP